MSQAGDEPLCSLPDQFAGSLVPDIIGPRTLASDSVGHDIPPDGDCVFASVCCACGSMWVSAGQSHRRGCQVGQRPESYLQTIAAVANVLRGSPDTLSLRNTRPQLIRGSITS